MAKTNLIGVWGAALSLACAGAFWIVAIWASTWGSGMTALEHDLRALMLPLVALYTIGAVVGLLSQLGAFLQLPSMAVSLPIVWYNGGHPLFYLIYAVGLFGASLLIVAMVVEYSRSDKEFKAPPFSRVTIWRIGQLGPGARPLPKGAAKVILAAFTACIVVIAAFAAYAWSSDVSDLRIQFVTDGARYGSMNITISVDGEEVYTVYIPYDPLDSSILFADTECAVPAGTHIIEVDAWNGADLDEGTVDVRGEARTLPFTTTETILGLGVGFQ